MSLDYGVLEKSDNVYVMKCDFGWADLGTWHGIYEATRKVDGDNVCVDTQAYFDDSHNNIVSCRKAASALSTASTDISSPRKTTSSSSARSGDSSSLIRKYVNEIQLKLGEKYV